MVAGTSVAAGPGRAAGRYDAAMSTAMSRAEVARRIAETALLRGRFTLRSGRESSFYLDKYMFSTRPEILRELGRLFADRLPAGTTRVAGAELGGIPLVTALSLETGLPAIFIRNARKDYGTSRRVEGLVKPEDRVAIVEDVATTGGQVLEAARILSDLNVTVSGIIATVDRLEGARENIESAGWPFDALFTIEDLGISPDAGTG